MAAIRWSSEHVVAEHKDLQVTFLIVFAFYHFDYQQDFFSIY